MNSFIYQNSFSNLRFSIVIFLITYFGVSLSGYAFKGFVYEMDSHRTKTLYTIERVESKVDNQEVLTIKHLELDKSLAVEEKAVFDQDRLIEYTVNYPKQNEQGKVLVKDNKVHYSYQKDNKEKTAVEKLEQNFVVGLSMKKFVDANWEKLVKGETLKIRFGVPDRRESVGFSLFRIKDQEKQKGIMVVKMKPSSFIIAALVNPVIFHYDLKTKDLLHFIGRAKPRQLVGKKWKDLDAETVYNWD